VSRLVIESEERISFLRDVSVAAKRVLVLEYDGTIAPFSLDRHRALPYPGLPELLRRIMTSCATRLIIISGRASREVRVLLGLNPAPEIWGSNGMDKLRADGRYEEIPVTVEASLVLAEAEACLGDAGLADRIEVTLASVAVHWRGLLPSKILKIRTKAYRVLEPLASQPDLVLADFEEGVEIRLSAASKGAALSTLLSDLDLAVPVAYLGDGATGEEAFRVLNGRGLTVLVRPKHRTTAAQMWLKPPDELIQFLTDWIRVCRGSRSAM
jgi:trehalose 6-phosphate phosphatase